MSQALPFWWACIEADYRIQKEIEGEEPSDIPDETVIFNYVANGCTAIVTAKDIRATLVLAAKGEQHG